MLLKSFATLKWHALLLCLFFAFVFSLSGKGYSQSIAYNFQYPMKSISNVERYGIPNHALPKQVTCRGQIWSNENHAGIDIYASPGDPVYAVAPGEVVKLHDGDYPGGGIVIKHTLPDGTFVYSVYGHLAQNPSNNPYLVGYGAFDKDKPIGTVLDQGNNTHLHFEIRQTQNANEVAAPGRQCSELGSGYTAPSVHPDSVGYLDPLVFINNFNYYTSASTAGYVSLFTDSFFRGGALGYLHPGHYNLENTAFNNIVSSIGMGGLTATAYDQNTLSGDWLSLYDSDTNLANNGFTDGVSSKGSADNAISSLTIYGGECSSQLIAASTQAATLGSSCNPNPAPAPGSQPLPPYTGSDTTPPRISAFNVSVSGAQAFLSVSASDLGGSGILDISYSAKINGTWRGVNTIFVVYSLLIYT